MGVVTPQLFTTVKVWRNSSAAWVSSYGTEEVVFDWSSDNAAVASRCSDADAMLATVGFANSLNADKKGKSEAAVYVIEPQGHEGICKIGVSTNPVRRLSELQGSHWAPLRIHALLWSPTRKAETVELRSLEAASEAGNRLMGEWVKMHAADALNLIIDMAKAHNVPLCDSATWVGNWKLRLEALQRARTTGATPIHRKVRHRPLYAA